MKLSILRKIVLSLVSAWLALIVFNDFIVVPKIFTDLSNRREAANLGMTIFSSLGSFEVVIGVILFLFAGLVFKRFRTKRSGFLFLLATCLCAFSLLGKFYLTPQITKLNNTKFSVSEESEEYQKANASHQLYHSFYIKIDGAKMLLLLAGILGAFRSSRFDNEKVITVPVRRVK